MESKDLKALSELYLQTVYEDKKYGYDKDGNSLNPKDKKAKKEPRWQDDDCDGKWYEKTDVDGKISKREKKAQAKHYKEGFSDWRQDLKEIPDYDQIPVDSKKSNEKITEKKVKNTVKINPNLPEGYGSKKKKKHDCASKLSLIHI